LWGDNNRGSNRSDIWTFKVRVQFYNFEDPEWVVLRGILERKIGDLEIAFIRVGVEFLKDLSTLKRLKGKKRVVILESAYERFPLRKVGLLRRLRYIVLDMIFKEKADLYFVGSDGSGGDVLAEKFKVNYSILPPSRFILSRGNKVFAREKLNVPLNGIYVGYAGYPTEEFGFDLLGKIYLLSGKTFKLLLYPFGGRDKFINFAKNFKEGVFMVDSFEDFLCAIDIAMFPYRFGGNSSLTITLLSLGIPIVSFVGHSADMVIKSGWNGFLVDNFDVKTFAEKLRILSTNPILMDNLAQNCKGFSGGFITVEEKANFIIQEVSQL
jgi:glycosyltransferase involved in cell wall biosynthesis